MTNFVRLGDRTTKIGSGQTPSGGYRAYSVSGIPLIRSQNVLMGQFSTDGLAYISAQIDNEMRGSRVMENDVLLNITGASIGRVCVVPKEICPANVNQHVCIIRCDETLHPEYVAAALASPGFQSMIWQDQAGATRQALTKEMIENFQIPWIPILRQCQVAARLKAQLAEIGIARQAAETVLHEINILPRKILAQAFED
jgi:type I restriction enzyme S subunit